MWQIRMGLVDSIRYIVRDSATLDGRLVSTNAAVIDPSDAKAVGSAMAATTASVGRSRCLPGSVLAHHVVQNFDPRDRISADQVHQMGVDFAEMITGGAHEYVVATHVDKDHLHNHIIFNAVSMETGLKFRVQRDTLARFRSDSDQICRTAGLGVLAPPAREGRGRSFGEVYHAVRGDSFLVRIRAVIDQAVATSGSWLQFESGLRAAGLSMTHSRGVLGFSDGENTVRAARLGPGYCQDVLAARLGNEPTARFDVHRSLVSDPGGATMSIRVPGTRGRFRLAVSRDLTLVQGDYLRLYLPTSGTHVLGTPRGAYATTVSTEQLYRWFSQPRLESYDAGALAPLKGELSLADLQTWGQALRAVGQLSDRVNARVRWDAGDGAQAAAQRAEQQVGVIGIRFQAAVVALSDALECVPRDDRGVRELAARCRQLGAELTRTRHDVKVLSAIEGAEKGPLRERVAQRAKALGTDNAARTPGTVRDAAWAPQRAGVSSARPPHLPAVPAQAGELTGAVGSRMAGPVIIGGDALPQQFHLGRDCATGWIHGSDPDPDIDTARKPTGALWTSPAVPGNARATVWSEHYYGLGFDERRAVGKGVRERLAQLASPEKLWPVTAAAEARVVRIATFEEALAAAKRWPTGEGQMSFAAMRADGIDAVWVQGEAMTRWLSNLDEGPHSSLRRQLFGWDVESVAWLRGEHLRVGQPGPVDRTGARKRFGGRYEQPAGQGRERPVPGEDAANRRTNGKDERPWRR